jgi:AcrR family transcriptional regulator
VAADALRITDGQSHCRIPDPVNGTVQAALIEIGLQGALVDTKLQLEENAYIDVTLVMRDQAPKQLFAHVVKCSGEGMRLRWLHFDPGEEGKLKGVLENYAKGLASKSSSSGTSTRRVVQPFGGSVSGKGISEVPSSTRRLVRPTASAITPFSDEPSTPATFGKSGNATPSASATESGDASMSGRVGTRRVVRPSQQVMTPFGDSDSGNDLAPGEESRTHQVVIETTDRFEKLTDVRVEAAAAKTRAAPEIVQAVQDVKDERASTSISAGEIVHTPFTGNPIVGATHGVAPHTVTAPQPAKTTGATGNSGAHPLANDDSGEHKATGGKTSVVGKDGKMDIGASIRTHAKTVRASELAARHDRVRVLNMATIKSLIQEAVEEVAGQLTQSLGEAERKRLLEEAEEGFQERLKEFQAEKQSSEERNKRLNDQLEAAKNLLEAERKRTIKADQFTVSAEGLGEIEDRFQRFLDRTLTAGKVPPDVEEDLRATIARILDSEREKIRERELSAQNAKIELLERKIGRLAGSLDESERQRDEAQRLAAFLESQGGGALRNVYTAGLNAEDPNKEKKLALMKGILDENRLLRQSLGIELNKVVDEPKAAPKAVAAPTPSAATVPMADVVSDEDKPADTPESEDVSDDTIEETSGEPEANPDDEVWEVKPLANLTQDVNEHGIKRMDVSAVLGKGPPPLERR